MTILQTLDRAAAVETRNSANAFTKVARLLTAARGDKMQALAMAEAQRSNARITGILKSAITGGSLTDWSSISDYVNISAAFSESLRSLGVFDAMLPSIVPAPLRSRGITVTTGIAGASPSERSIKPISSLALGNSLVEPRKSTAVVVVTAELAKSSDANANALFDLELRNGVVAATDATFLAALIAATTPTASAGSSLAQITTDMGVLLDGVTTSANSKLYFIASPSNMKKLLFKANATGSPAFPALGPTGGELVPGITAIASDQIASGAALLVDATGIAGSADVIGLDASEYATLQFDSAPDSPPTAATAMLSLFQSDSRALRAERAFGFTVLRASAVASLSGVAY